MMRMNIAPFLFRDDKPHLITDDNTNFAPTESAEATCILSIENNVEFLIDYANQSFINYTSNSKKSSLGYFISELDWIKDGNILQKKLENTCKTGHEEKFIWNFANNQKLESLFCRIIPLKNEHNVIKKITLLITDHSKQQEFEKEVEKYNYYDSLTELPNKNFFQMQVKDIFNSKNNISEVAIIFFNISKLQRINESYGYSFGDKVINNIVKKIQLILPQDTLLARFGEDKFICIITSTDYSDITAEAEALAKSINFELSNPLFPAEHQLRVKINIGIAAGSVTLDNPEELIENAHLAMQRIDPNSNNRILIYKKELRTRAESRLQIEHELQTAVTKKELELYYQPLICLSTGQLLGFEALCRWQHPEKGMISPNEFIPIAEETGLILPIGKWCMERACMKLKEWMDENPIASSLTINVNVSNTQIAQDDIVSVTRDALSKSKLDGQFLKLEITETTIMENADLARDILLDLKSLNISIAVDDFGTGYSSLSYLNRFPADTLKVDRSFVSQMDKNEESLKIVHIITSLASILGMNVVAEGIETIEQLETLRKMGCQVGQGFYFSRPIPEKDVSEYIQNHHMKMMQNN